MVEQPRSRGCRICVQRRIRCDLTRPTCIRCQKGDRPCPGYPADIQFHDEGARLRKLFGPRRRINGEGHSEQPPADVQVQRHWTMDSGIHSPFVDQRQLFTLFASALAPKDQHTPKLFHNYGDWLHMLSAMQGKDSLLDTTFRAVSLAHLSLAHQNPDLMHESRKLYGRSLTLLAKVLNEPTKGRSSETLSATVMLSFYEMFSSRHETSQGLDAWVKHAGGASALMQIRGPKAHRHGVDRCMFLAYRNTLLIESLDAHKPCFLDQPEWRQLAVDIHQDVRPTLPPNGRQVFDLSNEFHSELIQVPALLSDAFDVVELTRAAGGKRYQVMDDIAARAKKHVIALNALFLALDNALQNLQQAVKEQVSMPKDPVFPIRYVWPNVFTGSHYIGCWNTLLIINMILGIFDRDPSNQQSYVRENNGLARHICRGTDYMSQSSFLGPFFLTFALRTSMLALCDPQEQLWAYTRLMEIGSKLGMAKTPLRPDKIPPNVMKRQVKMLDLLDNVTD